MEGGGGKELGEGEAMVRGRGGRVGVVEGYRKGGGGDGEREGWGGERCGEGGP